MDLHIVKWTMVSATWIRTNIFLTRALDIEDIACKYSCKISYACPMYYECDEAVRLVLFFRVKAINYSHNQVQSTTGHSLLLFSYLIFPSLGSFWRIQNLNKLPSSTMWYLTCSTEEKYEDHRIKGAGKQGTVLAGSVCSARFERQWRNIGT